MRCDEGAGEEIYRQAVALFECGRFNEAWDLCEQSLPSRPQTFGDLHLLGVIAIEANHAQQAVELIGNAISINPNDAAAHNNRGNAYLQLGQCDDAIACYRQAISLQPDLADAHYNCGNAFFDLKRYDEAIDSYGRAIEIQASYWRAYNNRGLSLWCQKRHEEALTDYDRAIALEPDNPEAYNYRGHALRDMGEHAPAVASYDTAIKLQPEYYEAFNGRGSALAALNRLEAALESFNRAIDLRQDLVEAYLNRGNVLAELGQSAEAEESYDKAIALRPDFAEAHYKRGDALRELSRWEAAVASYDRAIAIKPDLKFLLGTRLHAKMQCCDWSGHEVDVAQLAGCIERGETACPPFALLALSGSVSLQLRAAEIYVRSECSSRSLPAIEKLARHDKIRIGYFSADFANHPVSYLTAALFELHDRASFEVIAFSIGPDTQDDMRKRLEQAFDRFIDVHGYSDREVARLARAMELDIAVDLGGFTKDARPGILAQRCAPLQLSYIGYLGTSAAPFVDYLIADKILVSAETRRHYSEKIVYLPSYQSNDPKRRIADRVFTREELGLPAFGFTFCCFNASYKITPTTFAGWMRILGNVPRSVLLLHGGSPIVEVNLRAEATRLGIDPGRLVFGKTLPRPEYMARFRAADLFLDTLPYNAGTTASDALWAGLPVLTCAGESFAGRMAASLLSAINMPELIAQTQDGYEALAVELATNGPLLSGIRRRLAEQRQVAPLFNIHHFIGDLEAGYRKIYERQRQGMGPADIDS